MDKYEVERLRRLRDIYEGACRVCDPIEFSRRHQLLLYGVCEFLTKPLEEYEEKHQDEIMRDMLISSAVPTQIPDDGDLSR